MLVEDDGTGRSTLDVNDLLRSVPCCEEEPGVLLYIERPRRGTGASSKMKNLMKANISRTIDSCPTRSPCVKDRLGESVSSKLSLMSDGAKGGLPYDDGAAAGKDSSGRVITMDDEISRSRIVDRPLLSLLLLEKIHVLTHFVGVARS